MVFAPGTSSIPPVDPRLGTILDGRYRVDRKIGEGGMGDVYEAQHLGIEKRVALKILHVSYASRPDVLKRFQREAQAATRIAHPHIVEVTDLGRTTDGCPYMVLELLEGRDLGRELEQHGPMPLGRIVGIVLEVCDALVAAHAKGIVHRDLKPENIFLCDRSDRSDFVKLLDFGISKFQGDLTGAFPMTVTGAALGTPYYMSPEQVRGSRDVDARSDVWSLGVILYRALAGVFPFDADSYPLLFMKICSEQPTPICLLREDLPLPFGEVVARMLAKDPDLRFQTCAEVSAALAPFAAHSHAVKLRAAPAASADRETRPGMRDGFAMRSAVDTLGAADGGGFVRSPSAELAGFASAELDLPAAPAPRSEAALAQATAASVPKGGEAESGAAPGADALRAAPSPSSVEGAYAPPGSWLGDTIPPAAAPELDVVPARRPVRVETASAPGRARRGRASLASGAVYDVVFVVVGCLLCACAAVAVLVGVRQGSSAFLGRADAPGLFRDGLALFFVGLAAWLVSGGARRANGLATAAGIVLWGAIAYGLAYGIDFVVSKLLGPG